MNFGTLEPKASIGDADAIKEVLGVLKVAKVKTAKSMKRTLSSGSVGISHSDKTLALCGPNAEGGDGMAQVEALEASFDSLRALSMEIEAQT